MFGVASTVEESLFGRHDTLQAFLSSNYSKCLGLTLAHYTYHRQCSHMGKYIHFPANLQPNVVSQSVSQPIRLGVYPARFMCVPRKSSSLSSPTWRPSKHLHNCFCFIKTNNQSHKRGAQLREILTYESHLVSDGDSCSHQLEA